MPCNDSSLCGIFKKECDGRMKITICDDSIEDLLNVEKLLLKYKELNPHAEYETEKYSDSGRLYHKLAETEYAEDSLSDLYILDMLMPVKTGIDLGKQIRKREKESIIIFTTSSDEYAMDSYQVHAVRYLLKPLAEEQFFEAMDYAFSCLTVNSMVKRELLYPVKTKEGIVTVPYSKIGYVENVSRVLHVHLTDGRIIKSVFIRKSFENETEALLGYRNFIQVHKSFVVNLQHVEKLTQESIIMENGEYVPVSKNKAAEVKRYYMMFVIDGFR